MRILLIKTSSLGDVIHNLPVASDLRKHFPAARIDWLVEEAFADIPRLHPGVDAVLPVALRRWRGALHRAATWRELRAFDATLRNTPYDLVIDSQGLLKSALLAARARGVRHGMDRASAREALAARFYDVRHAVPRGVHAIARNRALAAAAAGYPVTEAADYGLQAGLAEAGAVPPKVSFAATAAPVLLLTATSRADKLWDEAHWVALGQTLAARGLRCELPAGSAAERLRAARIAAQIPQAVTSPPLGIAALAMRMRHCALVVGVDTGLVHLAAALGRPAIALYCASSPALTGLVADAHAAAGVCNLGAAGAPPSGDAVLAAVDTLLAAAPSGERR